MFRKILNIFVIFCFVLTTVPARSFAAPLSLPEPGTMVNLSPAFEPVLIKGIKVHPENPFAFDFIVDTGSDPALRHQDLSSHNSGIRDEAGKLIKYFLASFTIPEKDLWVNLSPYEKDRMIAGNLGSTQMGQDMLAQDYILKQLTASLIYPERDLGKAFWDKVYQKAQQLYGTTEIPVNTFNKVWIVADKADVFERGNIAYIVGAHLKVMLEQDYLAMEHAGRVLSSVTPSVLVPARAGGGPPQPPAPRQDVNALGSQIVRDIILPSIEQEVNQGKNFAPLRQMFYSMILASWYKMALKDTILTQIYGNQSKVKVGINANDPTDKDKIFEQYLKAYKKGVFNYIKEDMDATKGQTVPRKYFSGGLEMNIDRAMQVFKSTLPPGANISPTGDVAMVSGGVNVQKVDGAMASVTLDSFVEGLGLRDDIVEALKENGITLVRHLTEKTYAEVLRFGQGRYLNKLRPWMASIIQDALRKHGFDFKGEGPIRTVKDRNATILPKKTRRPSLRTDTARLLTSEDELGYGVDGHIIESLSRDGILSFFLQEMTYKKWYGVKLVKTGPGKWKTVAAVYVTRDQRVFSRIKRILAGQPAWMDSLTNVLRQNKLRVGQFLLSRIEKIKEDVQSRSSQLFIEEQLAAIKGLQKEMEFVPNTNKPESGYLSLYNDDGEGDQLVYLDMEDLLRQYIVFLGPNPPFQLRLSHTQGVPSSWRKFNRRVRIVFPASETPRSPEEVGRLYRQLKKKIEVWLKRQEARLRSRLAAAAASSQQPAEGATDIDGAMTSTILADAEALIDRLAGRPADERMLVVSSDLFSEVMRIIGATWDDVSYGSIFLNQPDKTRPDRYGEFTLSSLQGGGGLWRGLRMTRNQLRQCLSDLWGRNETVAGDFVREVLKKEGDSKAMTAKADGAMTDQQPPAAKTDGAMTAAPGGIDLNRAKMQMNVRKEGAGVKMQFDPAMIERIKREGFDGLEFKIQSIVPVTDLPLLLGLTSSEGRLAGV